MNVGDPKKATVLGVVALLIVGMAVFQLMPKAGPKPAATAAQTEPKKDILDDTSLQKAADSLKVDPFAHPSLKPEKDPNAEAAAEETSKPEQTTGKTPPRPDWHPPAVWGEALPGAGLSKKPLGVDTSEVARQNQESEEKKPQGQIQLEAIVSVEKPRAFLSVDGKEAKAYKTGDYVGTLGRITKITENEVVIYHEGKRHVIPVGGQVKF